MLRTSKGVTIIELVLATVISTLLIGAILSTYTISLRLFNQEASRTDIFWDGQRAIQVMCSEIRESYSILTPNSSNITFWWKDLNNNGSREADETVSFSVSGNDLLRTIGSSTRSLASNVDSLIFGYDTTPDPQLVNIILNLSSQGEAVSAESKVKVRNEG